MSRRHQLLALILLALILLAPDIAERPLFMTNDAGHHWITERSLRGVVAHLLRAEQRRALDQIGVVHRT